VAVIFEKKAGITLPNPEAASGNPFPRTRSRETAFEKTATVSEEPFPRSQHHATKNRVQEAGIQKTESCQPFPRSRFEDVRNNFHESEIDKLRKGCVSKKLES